MKLVLQQPLLKGVSCLFLLSLLLHGIAMTRDLLLASPKSEPLKIQPTAKECADWLKVKKFNATPAKITASLHHLIQFYQLHCQHLEICLKSKDEGIVLYEVNLMLSALSDRVLKKFISHLQGQLQPFITIQTLKLVRVNKLNLRVLHAIGKGKHQKIIEAQLVLQWVAHEESSD